MDLIGNAVALSIEKIQQQGRQAWAYLRTQDQQSTGWRALGIAATAVILFGAALAVLFLFIVKQPTLDQTARIHAEKDALLKQKIENAKTQSQLAKNSDQLNAQDSSNGSTHKSQSVASKQVDATQAQRQAADTLPVIEVKAENRVATTVNAASGTNGANGISGAANPTNPPSSNPARTETSAGGGSPVANSVPAITQTNKARGAQEICSVKFIAFRSMCEWQECQKQEHTNSSYCRKLKEYYETAPEKTN